MKVSSTKTEPSTSSRLRNAVFGGSVRKRLLTLMVLMGLAALGTGVAKANDLFNATLDQTGLTSQNNPCPVGWVVDATKTISGAYFDGGDSETWCNVLDPDGWGFFFKPFAGSLGPPADLLTVQLYQDNACTPDTKCTLSGYAAGEANYSGFFNTNSPAPQTLFFVEFLDAGGNGLVTNEYDLVANGLPNGGPGSMALLTTPQYTAPANTATVRVGAWIRNTYSTTGSQSFFVDAFDLETVAPAGSPVITSQPSGTTVAPGGTATITVVATGATAYQWQLYSTNLLNDPGHISGATGPTLTITGASAIDVGHYRVRVSNAVGAVYSTNAPLALVSINFYPVVPITGKIGDTYRVDYSTAVAPTTWIPLSTNKLTTSPQLVIDSSSPGSNTRFYRAVFLY
jgi:hypothetical protein